MKAKLILSIATTTAIVASALAPVYAAAPNPATTTFKVNITLAQSCVVAAGPDINLGTQDQASPDAIGNSTFNVTCTKGTPYTIAMTPSNSDTTGAGAMAGVSAGNTDTVAYGLYKDAGATDAWGNVTGTNTVAGTGSGVAQPHTVIAKVLASEYGKQPDAYADTVTIAVSY